MCLGAFIWMLAYKEKDTDTPSETKSQTERKGLKGFLKYEAACMTQVFTGELECCV